MGPKAGPLVAQPSTRCSSITSRASPACMTSMWEPWIEPLLNEALFNRIRLHACEYRLVMRPARWAAALTFWSELDEPGSSGLMILGDLDCFLRPGAKTAEAGHRPARCVPRDAEAAPP